MKTVRVSNTASAQKITVHVKIVYNLQLQFTNFHSVILFEASYINLDINITQLAKPNVEC